MTVRARCLFVAGRGEVYGGSSQCTAPGCAELRTILCDYPLRVSVVLGVRQCDAGVCADHAVAVGPDKHYCYQHPLPAAYYAAATR